MCQVFKWIIHGRYKRGVGGKKNRLNRSRIEEVIGVGN